MDSERHFRTELEIGTGSRTAATTPETARTTLEMDLEMDVELELELTVDKTSWGATCLPLKPLYTPTH